MLRLSFINSPVKILTNRGGGGGRRGLGCPATEQKKTSAYIFTRATPLVAPKTVNFAPKRNATYMSEIPFPNLLSFYPCSQSLYGCSGARGYADVKTKLSGIDRFPFTINVRMGASGAPLRAPTPRCCCFRAHPCAKRAGDAAVYSSWFGRGLNSPTPFF